MRESREARGIARRAAWTLADQVISAAGNAGLSILVARAVGAGDFGAFALAFSVYGFMLGFSQAFAGQVIVIRYSAEDEDTRRKQSQVAAAVALIVGGVAGVSLVATVGIFSPKASMALAVVAIALPSLLLQDAWRSLFLAAGSPRRAFLNDALWTTLQLGLVLVVSMIGRHGVAWYLGAWGLSAAAAAMYGIRQSGVTPRMSGSLAFVRKHLDLSMPLLGQWLSIIGMAQLAYFAIAGVAGIAGVGALRGAQTLLGPVNVFTYAISIFAVPELARRSLRQHHLLRAGAGVSFLILLVEIAWGLPLLLLTNSAGSAVLGDSWSGARRVLPAMLLFTVFTNATAGCTTIFRAADSTRHALVASAVLGPLMFFGAVIGVLVHGTVGAAYGLAIAAGVMVVPTWLLAARVAATSIEARVPRASWAVQ